MKKSSNSSQSSILTKERSSTNESCLEKKSLSTTSSDFFQENNTHHYKIILIGDLDVGKTSLFFRFHDGIFPNGNSAPTIGCDFREKLVTIGDKKVNLKIFDTAGQERFQSLSQSYYRNVNGVLLLYDISSYSSFENVVRWIEKCPLNRSSILHTMLIGNKVDKSQRVVPRQVAERLADEYQMSFIETSAKTGQNVELAFLSTAQILLDKQVHRENQDRLEEKNIEIQSKSYFKRISKRCC